MDRYDLSAQLWIARGDSWQTKVIQQWYDTHTLPTPDEAGLPAAPQKQQPEKAPKKSGKWWQKG
jgi:hypothetical protein